VFNGFGICRRIDSRSDNAFRYVTLPVGLARRVVAEMNRAGTTKLIPDQPGNRQEEDERVNRIYNQWMRRQWSDYAIGSGGVNGNPTEQTVFSGAERLKGKRLGFVTKDACPGRGDDIEHIPGKPACVPKCILG
jgi:hypothetical protein